MTTRDGNDQPLIDNVRRRLKGQEEAGRNSLLANLGVIGFLGWLIVAPILAGLALGHWLDARLGTGITFTGACVSAGAVLGSWLAWRRIHQP
ncbi:MAG: AtpZ/AtpI family protein [Magnetospirillum sp.]|nr:AtpZ/AtpI family protein [Magnetospirillum sp.]